jgi:hypothetical protein
MGACAGVVNGGVTGDVLVVRLERWHGGTANASSNLGRIQISDEGHVAVDYGWGTEPLGQIPVRPGTTAWQAVYLALLMFGGTTVETN